MGRILFLDGDVIIFDEFHRKKKEAIVARLLFLDAHDVELSFFTTNPGHISGRLLLTPLLHPCPQGKNRILPLMCRW